MVRLKLSDNNGESDASQSFCTHTMYGEVAPGQRL